MLSSTAFVKTRLLRPRLSTTGLPSASSAPSASREVAILRFVLVVVVVAVSDMRELLLSEVDGADCHYVAETANVARTVARGVGRAEVEIERDAFGAVSGHAIKVH